MQSKNTLPLLLLMTLTTTMHQCGMSDGSVDDRINQVPEVARQVHGIC
jgi:hypothetical protein